MAETIAVNVNSTQYTLVHTIDKPSLFLFNRCSERVRVAVSNVQPSVTTEDYIVIEAFKHSHMTGLELGGKIWVKVERSVVLGVVTILSLDAAGSSFTQEDADALYQPIGDYVTDTELATTLGDYVTDTELTTALGGYVTDGELTSALSPYITTADANTAFLTQAEADALFLTPAEGNAAYQPVGSYVTSSQVRERLTANRTYFVRTDGNDSNTGLVDSAGGAFLTLQKAYDVAAALDADTYTVTITIRAGTFAGVTLNKGFFGALLVFNGAGATTIIDATGIAFNLTTRPFSIQISNLKIQATVAGVVSNVSGSTVFIASGVTFGACGSYCMRALSGAFFNITNNQTIDAGSSRFVESATNAVVSFGSGTTTLTGTPAFAVRTITATTGGIVSFFARTFSGAATGTRYLADSNGVISTAGAAADYIPGSIAGSTATGGQYV